MSGPASSPYRGLPVTEGTRQRTAPSTPRLDDDFLEEVPSSPSQDSEIQRRHPAPRRIRSPIPQHIQRLMLSCPSELLLCLFSEAKSERRQLCQEWMQVRGLAASLSPDEVKYSLAWIEDNRHNLVSQSLEELESLRNYRASENMSLYIAAEYINKAMADEM